VLSLTECISYFMAVDPTTLALVVGIVLSRAVLACQTIGSADFQVAIDEQPEGSEIAQRAGPPSGHCL
jgi:hypothetical protein